MDSDHHALDSLQLGEVALPGGARGPARRHHRRHAERDDRLRQRAGEGQFGYRREDLIGGPIEVLWPERVRERYRRNMEQYFVVEHPLSFTARAYGLRRDGSEFVGEMSWG